MDLGLTGKRALVVGAGSDVGRASAILLAQEGATVVLAGRSLAPLEATASAVRALGAAAEVVVGDTRQRDQAGRIAAAAWSPEDGLDILVNTVGPFPRDLAPEPMYGDDEGWALVFDTVFMTAVRICRELIPRMKGAGKGAVVNLVANSARYYNPMTAQYGAMKSALTHVTKNWARDAAPSGVRVNAVLPGWIRTAAVEQRLAEQARTEGRAVAEVEAAIVAEHDKLFWSPRMGAVEDYANVIAFLVSDRAAYVNGALVPVDGGSPVW